ncbi:MAG: bifunctional phosphopantothenoylcysteine decarboxylase/phosphopantothenate--cysteine ligase CoaBC [Rickettsiales bacterium]|nr:bifunctional phosphopantothenoylcysteine decarboxylase/phosphopantothenate--cysteine ligase CoaBC [Rickettsiales bacterium]
MKNKKILLIITGSIAAYKAMDLVRLLKKKSFDVTCVLTKSAEQFITPLLASSLSGNKTYNELFATEDHTGIDHIKLSREADLIVVAPATADFMAKMANGFADDLASNVILASNKKIMIAPAMNEKMWQNKQTEKNLIKLVESGISIVEPESDILACGEIGIGKMASPERICDKINEFFENKNLLLGKKILITGGATFEPIDPVRFIGNRSSGKQAIALAKVFSEMGADVTLVAANIREIIPLKKEKIINVKTADEMFSAVKDSLKKQDVFIACAAVADFKVKKMVKEKIKKTALKNLKLELVQNPDILEFVGHSKSRPQLVIGFAAESTNIKNYAKEKLKKKNCDLIVANDIEGGDIFGSNNSKAFFISKKAVKELGKITKDEVALMLGLEVAKLLS